MWQELVRTAGLLLAATAGLNAVASMWEGQKWLGAGLVRGNDVDATCGIDAGADAGAGAAGGVGVTGEARGAAVAEAGGAVDEAFDWKELPKEVALLLKLVVDDPDRPKLPVEILDCGEVGESS